MAQRFRFVQDDDCHWYAIPANKMKAFDRWIASFEDEKGVTSKESFEDFRLGYPLSCYTFMGLQEEK